MARKRKAPKDIFSDRRLYLTRNKQRVVEEGDALAAWLLAGAGCVIDPAEWKRLGLEIRYGRVEQKSEFAINAAYVEAIEAKATREREEESERVRYEAAMVARRAAQSRLDAAKREIANEDARFQRRNDRAYRAVGGGTRVVLETLEDVHAADLEEANDWQYWYDWHPAATH